MSDATLRAEQCVRACAPRAWRLAFALVWNRDDAFDVVQQACLVAVAKSGAIPADDPWPWFARVVTLEALKIRQARAVYQRVVDRSDSARASSNKGHAMDLDAALLAEREETQKHVRAALAALPQDQRDALTLTHIAGLTVRDAAATLGVSSSTVDRRVHEGLEELRRKLGGESTAPGQAQERHGSPLRSASSLPVALVGLDFGNPPQGMDAAVQAWLGAVHASAGTLIGASTMKIALFAGLGFVLVACAACGCFWHFHHDQAHEHLRALHELMRGFHGR